MAVGEAGRRVGGYFQTLITRYLVLSVAGTAFLGAIIFAILAGFWALTSRNNNPVASAAIMAGILVLVGLLIALAAYGITSQRRESPRLALSEPVTAIQSYVPTVEDVGRQIELAARQYGPLRVVAMAAAGGLVAGLLAKRFRAI
jgi:predicted lipid-binding transport protein (Tim44 family)